MRIRIPGRITGVLLLVFAIILLLYLALTSVKNEVSAKQDMGDVVVTSVSGIVYAQMTQAAYTPTPGTPPLSAAEIAATAMAAQQDYQSTQAAADRLAEERAQATQDAQEAQAAATEQAQSFSATSTQEYWRGVYWSATQTQDSIYAATAGPATQAAYEWTLTAIPLLATAEANQINAQQTIVAGQAADMSRKVQQEAWAAPMRQFVTFLVLIGAIGAVLVYVLAMKQVRKLTPDGTVTLLDLGKRGGMHVVRSTLLGTPVASVTATGQVTTAGASPDQKDINKRAQTVDALAAVASAVNPPRTSPFEYVSDLLGNAQPRFAQSEPPADLIDVNALKSLDTDWKEG